MNRDAIIKLEEFLFVHKKKPNVAAHMMADYLGVMIGIKSAAVNYFDATEYITVNPKEYIENLNQVGLKALFFRQEQVSMDKLTWIENIYVAHNIETAKQLHRAFVRLHSTIDDASQFLDRQVWEDSSREIGRLLGYPSTAVEYFITEQDINNEERKQLMKRYRFYVHSPEHHEEEYQAYDHKIFQALQEYAPRSAKILTSDK